MSQVELGRLLGVSDKAISRWENETAKPRTSLLPKLARVLGVPVGVLMGDGKPGMWAKKHVACGYEVHKKPQKTGIADTSKINFIPENGVFTGNYYSTWEQQAAIADGLDIDGESLVVRQRNALNEDTVFVEEFFHPIEREYRGDLLFLLDDGWDVPYDIDNYRHTEFGILAPDAEKFKSLGDTPLERLIEVNARIKELGYRGLGVWVSPVFGETPIPVDAARAYWEEKARLSQAAGVLYWKVDWGINQDRDGYQEMMTECVRKYAPDLMIEHAKIMDPFFDLTSDNGKSVRDMCKRFCVADVLRTYHVEEPFADIATFARVDSVMKQVEFDQMCHGARGFINVESQPLVAVGLGFNLGIMNYDPLVEAALRWQRIAPAYGAHLGTYVTSQETVTDSLLFDTNPAEHLHKQWETYTVTVPQAAARNTRLPKTVCDGIKPIVLACGHPDRDVLSVVTLKRTIDPNRQMAALADVTAFPKTHKTTVGIFGYYRTLILEYPDAIPKGTSVWAQCMLNDYAENITDLATINGNTLTIDGTLLRKLGHKADDSNTEHDPVIIIKLG